MGYQPIENLLPKAGYSIYKLVRLAACRAIELADGQPRLIANPGTDKSTTTALEEIQAGRVVIKDVAGQFSPDKKKSVESEVESKA